MAKYLLAILFLLPVATADTFVEPKCDDSTCILDKVVILEIVQKINNMSLFITKQQTQIFYLEQVCATHAQGS